MNDKLDKYYHIALLDPKTHKIIGKEEQYQTLEEVLGFLHRFEESSEKIRGRMLACLMGLRDGASEVTIHREEMHAGDQILRIRPPEKFHQLFWEGTGAFKKVKKL